MLALPSVESWTLVKREIFVLPVSVTENINLSTEVMHFGASFRG
jgi:hypothetical protein